MIFINEYIIFGIILVIGIFIDCCKYNMYNISERISTYVDCNNYNLTDNSNDKTRISGIVNTLGYTPYGGSILKTSVAYFPGTGKINITGSIGEVMEESIEIAISYIKSHYKKLDIDLDVFNKNDFHIHFEDGATHKDGPSAGITIVTGILSVIKNKIIEIIAAKRNNIETIFLPKDNDYDLNNIEEEVKKDIDIILVNDYMDIYKKLFKNKNT